MAFPTLTAMAPDEIDRERRSFLEAVDELLPERDTLVDRFNELIDKFNGHWDWLHRNIFNRDGYAQERALIDEIRHHIEEATFPDITGGGSILDVADRVINHHTPVVSLFIASLGWVQDVMSPTSEVYNQIWTVEDGRRLAGWGGEARSSYDDIIGQQQSATTAAKDLASFMSGWLSTIAEDNIGYVRFLLDKITEIANHLFAAIAAIGTSGGVFTLEDVANAIGTAVAAAIDHLGEIAERIASALTNLIDAEAALSDFSHFPNANWPEAVSRV